MKIILLIFLLVVGLQGNAICSVEDSTILALSKISNKYLKDIDNKFSKYNSRVTAKTIRTLKKMSRWENKIKSVLEKVSPETVPQLFGNPNYTFSGLLAQLQNGETLLLDTKATYFDTYRDKVTTNLRYIESKKGDLDSSVIGKIKATNEKMGQLNDEEEKMQAVQDFIKERKKELIKVAFKHLGKNKYLQKINKESWYYIETLKNYKEILGDPSKSEEVVAKVLNTIPAFKEFFKKNSFLSQLFSSPASELIEEQINGLQTRASVQNLLRDRIASGGPNAQDVFNQQVATAQAQLNALKNKIQQTGGGNSDENDFLPNFKPNTQRTKTFLQRLDFGTTLQFGRQTNFMPSFTDLGATIGYRFNDRMTVGFGGILKIRMGNISKIHFSTEAFGVKSYFEWLTWKSFFMAGGYERNWFVKGANSQTKSLTTSALIGLSKKINLRYKFMKSSKVQLLFDLLAGNNRPQSQSIVFRLGYNF